MRSISRLLVAGFVSTLVFLALEVPLGYATIHFQFGSRPAVARSEFNGLVLALTVAVPLVFILSMLGMALAWSTFKRLTYRSLLWRGCVSGAVVAVAATIEQIPRDFGEWLAFLLPVLVVVANYWLVLFRSPRQLSGLRDA
jgi:hypothetical protein